MTFRDAIFAAAMPLVGLTLCLLSTAQAQAQALPDQAEPAQDGQVEPAQPVEPPQTAPPPEGEPLAESPPPADAAQVPEFADAPAEQWTAADQAQLEANLAGGLEVDAPGESAPAERAPPGGAGGQWVEEHYGLEMTGVWGGTLLGAVVLAPVTGGVSLLLLGVPPALLHFSHGNVGYGVLDIFAIYGTAFLGGAVGAATCDSSGDGFGCLGNVLGGVILGALAWPIIDIAFLTQKSVWRDGPTAQVAILPTEGGTAIGLSGRF